MRKVFSSQITLKKTKTHSPRLIFAGYLMDTCVQPTPQKLIHIAIGTMSRLYNDSSLIIYNI